MDKIVISEYRLTPPSRCPRAIYSIMMSCWYVLQVNLFFIFLIVIPEETKELNFILTPKYKQYVGIIGERAKRVRQLQG